MMMNYLKIQGGLLTGTVLQTVSNISQANNICDI